MTLRIILAAFLVLAAPSFAYATGDSGYSDEGNGGDEGNNGEANDGGDEKGNDGGNDGAEPTYSGNTQNGGCIRCGKNERTPDKDAIQRLWRNLKGE